MKKIYITNGKRAAGASGANKLADSMTPSPHTKEMKYKPLIKKIFEPVYRFDLLFIVGCEFTEVRKIVPKYGIDDIPLNMGDSTGAVIRLSEEDFPTHVKGVVWLLWLKDRNDYYCLMHEIAHLVIKVFERKGIEIEDKTSEPFAYYFEMWARTLWKLMSQHTWIRKRKVLKNET